MTVTDRTYDEARHISAGIRYLEHRHTVRDALEFRLDELVRRGRTDAYFARGDWRQALHRRRLAGDIRDLRAALRELPR